MRSHSRIDLAAAVQTAAAVILLPALTFLIYGSALETRPFEGDNLFILAWADATAAGNVLQGAPERYPEWRPLAYATVWLQYQQTGFHDLRPYFLVNMLLWTACGWLVIRIVVALSGSFAAACAAAVLMLTSTQLTSSIVLIVERQSSLVCLFGLAAWLLVIGAHDRPLSDRRLAAISLLLAAAALSKEYGLAFTGAVAMHAIVSRQWRLASASLAAAAAVAVGRIWTTGRAFAPYCEDHGFFFGTRTVCFDTLDAQTITQAAYNVAATGVASLLPGLFFDDGTVSVSPRWLAMSFFLLVAAVLSWAKGPKTGRIGLFAIALNTSLSFLLYRSRNHAIAVCAMSIAAGAGLPILWSGLLRLTPARPLQVAVLAAVLSIFPIRMLVARQLTTDRVELASHPDPCGPDIPELDPSFMQRLWSAHDLEFPGCPRTEPRPATAPL